MTPQPESLVRLAEHSIRTYAARPVFGERVGGTWSWMTYAELGVQIQELRSGLAALGVNEGDRVALISRNSAAWAASAYATYSLGAAFVPMYESQRHEDWEFILRDCNASVVFVRTPEIAAAIGSMRGAVPAIRHVITIEGPEDDPASYAGLRRLGREHIVPPTFPDPDAIAGFIYTSGTTGKPKGVMLSHGNFASNVLASTSIFPIGADDRSVSFLPWAHVMGQTVELHILIGLGASTAFNRDVTKLVDDNREIGPTMLVAVPRIFNKIHDGVRAKIATKPRPIRALFKSGIAASIRRRRGEKLGFVESLILWLADLLVFRKIRHMFGGRLKYTFSGGGMLSREVGEFIDALGLDVYEGYGLTETAPIITANRPGERKLGSVGRTIPGVRIRIDESVGNSAGVGEIIAYGPNVMKGYHARREENAKVFTEDGGLRTGDLGRIDEDGYLYITGRIKEQYKLENGKYVVPTPLEEQLGLSPFITSVMLYGADRPYNVALVVIDAGRVRAWATAHARTLGADLTHDPVVHELIEHELAEQSAKFRGYERPRAFVVSDEEFTTANGMLTPSLKLKRHSVIAKYGAMLEALYQQPAVTLPPVVQPSAPAVVAQTRR